MNELEAITGRLNERAAAVRSEADKAIAQINKTRDRLHQATDDFRRTGVAFISAELSTYLKHWVAAPADTYFRQLAKDTNRMPIIAIEDNPYNWQLRGHVPQILLTMPKHKRLQHLMAGLLLLSQEMPNDEHAMMVDPIGRNDSPGMWRLFFNGKEGRKLFEEFRERCHTDPVLRCVLRL